MWNNWHQIVSHKYACVPHQTVRSVGTVNVQPAVFAEAAGGVKRKQEGWYLKTVQSRLIQEGFSATLLQRHVFLYHILKQNSNILGWFCVFTGETMFISQRLSLWGKNGKYEPHSLTYLNVCVCVGAWHAHGQNLFKCQSVVWTGCCWSTAWCPNLS